MAKKQSIEVAEADVEFKKAADNLVDVVIDNIKEGYKSDLEPFEAYAERVRAEMYSNIDDFRTRFLNGYHVILEELAKEKKENLKIEDKPPPGTFIM